MEMNLSNTISCCAVLSLNWIKYGDEEKFKEELHQKVKYCQYYKQWKFPPFIFFIDTIPGDYKDWLLEIIKKNKLGEVQKVSEGKNTLYPKSRAKTVVFYLWKTDVDAVIKYTEKTKT